MTDRTDPERHPGAWLRRPGPDVRRTCSRCGEPFVLPVPSARYCSPACREEVEAERRLRKQAWGRGTGSE